MINRAQLPLKIVLNFLSFMIIIMILIGGVTRLERAGLSIVEWAPIKGIVPPLSEHDWQTEFTKYKAFPEYKSNKLLLKEFKYIYYLEYFHRLWGRVIAIFFVGAFSTLLIRKKLQRSDKKNTLLSFALLLIQGYAGWYMVKSGLHHKPEVSHYRLLIHFLLALALLGKLSWWSWSMSDVYSFKSPKLLAFTKFLLIMLLVTIIYGALLAGLKGGLIYNEFPLMGGRLFPEDGFFLHPLWINFFENPATVQFIHRCLAIVTVLGTISLSIYGYAVRRLPPFPRNLLLMVGMVALLQGGLGILTLLMQVPTYLAAAHQITGVFFFLLMLRAGKCFKGIS